MIAFLQTIGLLTIGFIVGYLAGYFDSRRWRKM